VAQIMRRKRLFGAWAFALSLLGGAVQAQPAAAPAAPITFRSNCAACHGATLLGGPGGPPLVGPTFRSRWSGSPAALEAFVREKMPPGAPGSLSVQDYAEITAFLLRSSGPAHAETGAPAVAAGAADAPPPPAAPSDPTTRRVLAGRQATLARLRPVTDAMLRDPPAGSWLNWRRTYDAHGFGPETQIDRRSVARLGVAWSWQLAPGLNEITPLVHDGVMFLVSAGRLDALDARTGDLLWRYQRPGPSGVVRNLAIYGERIYYAAENSVVALDMRSGKLVWETAVTPPGAEARLAAGPLAAKGLIFQGVGNCYAPVPGGCALVALDAATGKQTWRFETLAKPGHPGGDTWNGAPADQRTGGSIWLAPSCDPDLDLLYVGVGQTYHAALLINGPNIDDRAPGLYTSSTLALRPATGEVVWSYQHISGDIWDLDWAFERTLATQQIGGKPRRTVTTAGKLAIFDTLDAATGEYLYSTDMGLQTLVKSIDPRTGAKHIDPAFNPSPGVERVICPSVYGGRDWPSTAYNPRTGVVFAPLNETCMGWTYMPGQGFRDWALRLANNGGDGLVGRLQAFDLATGKVLWTVRERAPQAAAMLATAGGVVFEGSRDRWFRARDDRSGKILWQTRLDAPPSAYPITYSVDGEQYVAVTAGGGNFLDTALGKLTPEVVAPAAGSTTLWVFKLPKR
jgi:alcohol dehydrogenase (cytochrome c)